MWWIWGVYCAFQRIIMKKHIIMQREETVVKLVVNVLMSFSFAVFRLMCCRNNCRLYRMCQEDLKKSSGS
jgi:hypothetical protein